MRQLTVPEELMRVYIGIDDTDYLNSDRGTGKVARWLEKELPDDCRLEGVIRQQLLIHERIPYTSNNSAACLMVSAPDPYFVEILMQRSIVHVERYALSGSDPGICVTCEGDPGLQDLIAFGRACTRKIVTQKDAMEAASHAHLSGHGGTNDGMIGAAAAVGLTASGWSGRFIEYGRLRDFPELVRVVELSRSNILVVSVDRDAEIPAPEDLVCTKGWLRPRFLGSRATVFVTRKGSGMWESLGEKRNRPSAEPRQAL
jgi:hypothetical protein